MMWVPTNEEIILHVREIPCLVPCGWDHRFPVISMAQISRIWLFYRIYPQLIQPVQSQGFSLSIPWDLSHKKYFLSSFCPRVQVRMGAPFHFFLHVSQWMTPPSLFLVGYEEPQHVSAVISQPGFGCVGDIWHEFPSWFVSGALTGGCRKEKGCVGYLGFQCNVNEPSSSEVTKEN